MSSKPKIVCVTPTCRPESHAAFVAAWRPLFERHAVTLVTVWDGDNPTVDVQFPDGKGYPLGTFLDTTGAKRDLYCRRTDAVRNIGFVVAASMKPDFVVTFDDDVRPVIYDENWDAYFKGNIDSDQFTSEHGPHDPIAAHLDALSKRVPLGCMNTAHAGSEYLRGVPYGIRDEAPVMLSHGVWVGTPDFDGETQLAMERCPHCNNGVITHERDMSSDRKCDHCRGTGKSSTGVPKSLPYFVGPIPRGVLFPFCGMSAMIRREALPYFYYAPMGPDSGFPDLHRFSDIFAGIAIKQKFDRLGWACYSGQSVVLHGRASDAKKNFQQERLGREWMEWIGVHGVGPWSQVPPCPPELGNYLASYSDKRLRYRSLIEGLLCQG